MLLSGPAVLSSGGHGGGGSSANSSAAHASEAKLSHCGANFCVLSTHGNDNLERPPDSEIYEISTIYLCCVVAAVAFVAFMVDPLSR